MSTLTPSRRNVMRALAAITTGLPTLAYAMPRTGLVCLPASGESNDAMWDDLVAAYRRDTIALSAHPYGNTTPSDPHYAAIAEDHELQLDRACKSLDAVMEHPVRDNAMLAEKLEIMVREFGGDNFVDRILADARRLSAEVRA